MKMNKVFRQMHLPMGRRGIKTCCHRVGNSTSYLGSVLGNTSRLRCRRSEYGGILNYNDAFAEIFRLSFQHKRLSLYHCQIPENSLTTFTFAEAQRDLK